MIKCHKNSPRGKVEVRRKVDTRHILVIQIFSFRTKTETKAPYWKQIPLNQVALNIRTWNRLHSNPDTCAVALLLRLLVEMPPVRRLCAEHPSNPDQPARLDIPINAAPSGPNAEKFFPEEENGSCYSTISNASINWLIDWLIWGRAFDRSHCWSIDCLINWIVTQYTPLPGPTNYHPFPRRPAHSCGVF